MTSIGKIDSSLFEKVIYPKLGAVHREVLVGPKIGSDAAIVLIDDQTVLTLTTDPFFLMPELGWQKAVWFAIHILVSDSMTTAIQPRWLTLDLNLPLELSDLEFQEIWEHIHQTCLELNLSIVTGHTGRYEGCYFPTIGSGTVLGIGSKDLYVTPQMANVGDIVLVTKSAALETTALLGNLCYEEIAKDCGVQIAQSARDLFYSLSVFEDARIAASVGVRENGITSMHDATERGVQGAIVEVAQVSQKGMLIYREEIPILQCTEEICRAYKFDPYKSSSEGTLLLTCNPQKVQNVLSAFRDYGIPCTEIGVVVSKEEEICWLNRDGTKVPIEMPIEDPFWPILTKLKNRNVK